MIDESTQIICPNKDCKCLLHVPTDKGDIPIRCPQCEIQFDYSPSLIIQGDFDGDTFSYSRIQLFEKCPKAYELKYIEKIEEEFSTIERYLGSCIHSVIELAYKKKIDGYKTSLKELLKYYDSCWQSEYTDDIVIVKSNLGQWHYWQEGKKMISSFYRRKFKKDKFTTLALEHEFYVSLGPNIGFKGIIDRISRERNGFIILTDYKTGKRIPDPNVGLQLKSYALYAFSKWSETIKLCYEDLRNKRTLSSFINISEQEKIRSSLTKAIYDIIIENDFEAEPSILCKWCGYNRICDYAENQISHGHRPRFNTESNGTNICPRCGGELEERSGKYGIFIGCDNFPDCRYTRDNQ